MRKIYFNVNHPEVSFNNNNKTRNSDNYIINNIQDYMTLQPNFSRREKNSNYLNNINLSEINNNSNNFNNINNNNIYYKNIYTSPHNNNFINYMNNITEPKYSNLTTTLKKKNLKLKNTPYISNNINNNIQSNNSNDMNLMTMRMNFKLLEQKIANLGCIIKPKSNLMMASNISLKKRYNPNDFIFYNTSYNKSNDLNSLYFNSLNGNQILKDNNSIKNKNINNNNVLRRNKIKRKFLSNNLINTNHINNKFVQINNISKSKSISKEKDNNNFANNKNNNYNNNTERLNIQKLLNVNKSVENMENNLNNLSNKESEIISDEELSYLADELVSTIKRKKKMKRIITKEYNNEKNKKIINKETSINNNFIITNISGTVNCTPPSEKYANTQQNKKETKIVNKQNFQIYKNNFTINCDKKIENNKKTHNVISSVSSFFFEENNKNKKVENEVITKGDEIIIPGILDSSLNKEKNKNDITNKENDKNINDSSSIHKPIYSHDDLNENNKINNKKINLKYIKNDNNKNETDINNNFIMNNNNNTSYEDSRNKKLFNNFIKNEKKKLVNDKLGNISNKKRVSFENDLISICYNDKDKPTKINLYKLKNNKDPAIKIEFKPKNIQTYINNLKENKNIKSILLNKDDENIVRRDFHDMPFKSMDSIERNKKAKKNIMKRNIQFIKDVEEKVKNQSLEKNKKNGNKSISKGKNKNLNKKEKTNQKENTNKNKNKNKKDINNTNRNNSNQKKMNNYIKIDVIQEEEEGCEDSKHDKKIDIKF